MSEYMHTMRQPYLAKLTKDITKANIVILQRGVSEKLQNFHCKLTKYITDFLCTVLKLIL